MYNRANNILCIVFLILQIKMALQMNSLSTTSPFPFSDTAIRLQHLCFVSVSNISHGTNIFPFFLANRGIRIRTSSLSHLPGVKGDSNGLRFAASRRKW